MTLRTKISLPLVTIHLVLVALCFGAAIYRPERSALAPVVVFLADMPASLVFEPLRHSLHSVSENYTSRLLLDATVYLVLGTVWWIIIGTVLAWIFSCVLRRS
jgi:hypothetical protein